MILYSYKKYIYDILLFIFFKFYMFFKRLVCLNIKNVYLIMNIILVKIRVNIKREVIIIFVVVFDGKFVSKI